MAAAQDDTGAMRRLPRRPPMRTGEALDSYLEQLATANHLRSADVVRTLTSATDTTRYLMLAPTERTLHVLSGLTGLETARLRAATLAHYADSALDLTGLDPHRQASYRTVAGRGWIPGSGTQICPECLADTGAWKIAWRLPTTTTCTTHGTYLLAVCPGCDKPFRAPRHALLRPVGNDTVCGNARASRGRHCCTDLTTLTAPAAAHECLDRQQRYDSALETGGARVFGEQATAKDYHQSLRSLTVLLLHIATATDIPSALPEWAQTINRQGTESTRAPRWGLTPPDEVALRSQALTAADHVLAATDVDEAVVRLAPWTSAVPDTPDGFLGWVGDHTTPSLTVTRLVMAAHAPRRRLSHALDSLGPLTPDPANIPQVVPEGLYEQHLAGLFTSRPETLRTFASLCLARTHPVVETWAAAAQSLGLDPRLGVKTAQACTTAQQASPSQVVQAMKRLAEQLPQRNFREREQLVRALARADAWFTTWVCQYRPHTRPESKTYALTYVWTYVAEGHITTSPAWVGAPTGEQRSQYRRFVKSLTTDQMASLSRAPGDVGWK